MANNKKYRFTRGKDYIIFDSEGYVLESKGLGTLIWHGKTDIDKDVVGKHIDELAKMLEKSGVTRDAYFEFEANVHVKLLKAMLKEAKK